MTSKELRQRSTDETRALLREFRAKLHTMRFELAQGKVKNTAALDALRKDIARALTVLREKTIMANGK